MLIVCAQVTLRKTYINIVNTLCNNVNSELTFHYKYSKMAMQINDIENDLDDISILQTEDGNTSDITINYISDASRVGLARGGGGNSPQAPCLIKFIRIDIDLYIR